MRYSIAKLNNCKAQNFCTCRKSVSVKSNIFKIAKYMNNKSTNNYRHNTRLGRFWSAFSWFLNFEQNPCLRSYKSFLLKKKISVAICIYCLILSDNFYDTLIENQNRIKSIFASKCKRS